MKRGRIAAIGTPIATNKANSVSALRSLYRGSLSGSRVAIASRSALSGNNGSLALTKPLSLVESAFRRQQNQAVMANLSVTVTSR